jgi:alcohol dehydrogenase class IV
VAPDVCVALRALGGGGDLEALSDVLLGCLLAEVSSSQSGLGALEACVRPITSSVGEAAALAILLPEVVRWNMRVVADRYAELAAVRGEARRPETLVARLEDFVLAGGFPGRLGAAGIVERDLPALAELAAAEPAALNNPGSSTSPARSSVRGDLQEECTSCRGRSHSLR